MILVRLFGLAAEALWRTGDVLWVFADGVGAVERAVNRVADRAREGGHGFAEMAAAIADVIEEWSKP